MWEPKGLSLGEIGACQLVWIRSKCLNLQRHKFLAYPFNSHHVQELTQIWHNVTFPTIGNIVAIKLFAQATIVCACVAREREDVFLWGYDWSIETLIEEFMKYESSSIDGPLTTLWCSYPCFLEHPRSTSLFRYILSRISTFEWCVLWCCSKNNDHKDACFKNIGLHTQILGEPI